MTELYTLGGLAALVSAVIVWVFSRGRKAERAERVAAQDAEYRETRKRMDDAVQNDSGALPADALKWLRERFEQRSL